MNAACMFPVPGRQPGTRRPYFLIRIKLLKMICAPSEEILLRRPPRSFPGARNGPLHGAFILLVLVYDGFLTCPNGRSMTDQTLGLSAGGPRTRRLRSLAAKMLRSCELPATTSRAIAALIVSTLFGYFWLDGGRFPTSSSPAGVRRALIAFFVVLSREVPRATALWPCSSC